MNVTDLIYKVWPDVEGMLNKAIWTAVQVFMVTLGADWADWTNTDLLQKAAMAAGGAAIVVVKEAFVQWREGHEGVDDMEPDPGPEIVA